MNKLEKIFFIGLLGLAWPFPAYAGDPVPGIDISLEEIPGGKMYQGTTDSEGAVVFSSVTPGTYRVIVSTKERVPAHNPEWTDLNSSDSGVSLSVSGKAVVAHEMAHVVQQQKQASATPDCSPIAINEEGVQRKSDVAIKEEGVNRSKSPPDTKLEKSALEDHEAAQMKGDFSRGREPLRKAEENAALKDDVAAQGLGVAFLSKLNEGPVCTLIDISEEGEIILYTKNYNSSLSSVNHK